MKTASSELLKEYQDRLQDYLAGAGEVALKRGHELGRAAITEGLGVLEVSAMQNEALVELLKGAHSTQECIEIAKAASNFAVESLSAFEMTHRGFRETNITLRRLNEKLNERFEEGAKQVAHALHDQASQLLAAVNMAIDQAAHDAPARSRKSFQEVRKLLKEVEEQLRRLSHELRPMILDDLGVVPALEFLARGNFERTGIPITIKGSTNGRLPPQVETVLYRTVQEALTNMAKHARARAGAIRIQRNAKIVNCAVRDDGVGFDVPGVLAKRGDRGLGLISMQERLASLGGTLQINSTPNEGTEVVITIPLDS